MKVYIANYATATDLDMERDVPSMPEDIEELAQPRFAGIALTEEEAVADCRREAEIRVREELGEDYPGLTIEWEGHQAQVFEAGGDPLDEIQIVVIQATL